MFKIIMKVISSWLKQLLMSEYTSIKQKFLVLSSRWRALIQQGVTQAKALFTAPRMVNCIEDSNVTSTEGQPSAMIASIAVFLSALNIFLSITASLGNALILAALHKVSSVHPPTKLLFRCLAVTDLCHHCTRCYYKDKKEHYMLLYPSKLCFGFILCGVSVFTSTAISVDRLLALLLGLRYRHFATLRRVRVVITCFLSVCVLGAIFYFYLSRRNTLTAATVFVILCVFISVFSFTKTFLTLR